MDTCLVQEITVEVFNERQVYCKGPMVSSHPLPGGAQSALYLSSSASRNIAGKYNKANQPMSIQGRTDCFYHDAAMAHKESLVW
jgi:hypothetical protein